MFKQLFISLTVVISSPALSSEFGDPEQGKIKSPSCVYCHGSNGVSSNSSYPNLAGQDPLYLFNTMKGYQRGERQGAFAEMMKSQLRQLNDQDLKDIAAFYSNQSN